MALERRTLIAASGIVVGLSLVGGAVWLFKRPLGAPGSPLPLPTTAPPIESVTQKYPNLKKLVDDPKVGSVLKEFAIAYNKGGVEGAKAFAKERGFMNGNDDITLTLLTETDDTAALEATVVEQKGKVVGRGDQSIDVLIPWSVVEEQAKSGKPPEELLDRLSKTENVRGVLPMNRPTVHQKDSPLGARGASSEGVRVSRADLWHKAGYRGQGVKVGVLDPEVSKAGRFVGSALPAGTPLYAGSCVNAAGVGVDDEGLHGVAAAEIVHEMAPDAQIYLACSLGDEDAAINWLLAQGVKIISYSAGGTYGPRTGKGRSQSRIDALAKKGVLWVNAAGNDGKSFHRGSLEGGPSGAWHSFGPGRTALGFTTQIETNIRITVIWNEWNNAVISDYDLYLFDAKMQELARSEDKNTFIRQPSEQIAARLRPNSTYYVGIRNGGGTRPASFVLNVHGAHSIEQNDPRGSLTPPADAAGALAVGGVVWNTDQLAAYSSRGPTEDGRLKPEISAPTQVSSTVYGGSFAGTSAAAPHVAGAAALVWGRFPNYSRNDVVNTLTSRARDLGAPGPDNEYGAGRLDLGEPGAATGQPPVAIAPRVTPPGATATPGVSPGTAPTATDSPPVETGGEEPPSSGASRALVVVVAILGLGAVGAVVVIVGVVSLIGSALSRGKPQRPAAPAYQPRQPLPFAALTPMAAPHAWPAAGPRPSADASGWSASLVPLSGFGARGPIALVGSSVTIGRGPENALVIPAPNVSHRHAYVQIGPQGCTITDLGSSNGTYVNGTRIKQHFLRPGDMVQIGPASFRFDVRSLGA